MTDFKFDSGACSRYSFRNGQVDLAGYGKVLDFHLRGGAESLAIPMHAGESVSLTVGEREALLEFAIGHVKGRVPVIANVSEAGTEIAASLASHAAKAGAAAVIAIGSLLLDAAATACSLSISSTIGKAAKIPLFRAQFARRNERGGNREHVRDRSVKRLPNMAGLIDLSLDWQYMIEVITVARAVRPDFQLVSGTEYMISAAAIGATGLLSPLAAIAPKLIGNLYALCMAEKFTEAGRRRNRQRYCTERCTIAGVGGFKTGLQAMGRDCGIPRPPLASPSEADTKVLLAGLAAASVMNSEPRGWA